MRSIDSIDISVIMALYDVKAVGRTAVSRAIAEKLKITSRTALRKIQTIEKLKCVGIYLSIEYSIRMLGLKNVVVLTEDENFRPQLTRMSNYFMRSIFYLVPNGVGAVLFIPYEEVLPLPKLSGKHPVMELTERMRNRTDLMKYGICSVTEPKTVLTDKNFKILKDDIERFMDAKKKFMSAQNYRLMEQTTRFDWIDLAILKELEKDPLKRLDEISQATKTPISKIGKHANAHVSSLLRGIRIRFLPIYEYFDVSLLVRIKAQDTATLDALGKALMRNPLFPGYGYSCHTNEALAQAVVPFPFVRTLIRHLEKLGREFGYDVDTDNIWLFTLGGKRFSVPYVRWKEYIPRMNWNIETLVKLVSSMGDEH